ncbi:MAG: hypothetical protein ACR2P2_13130 [Nakamurella sp.]
MKPMKMAAGAALVLAGALLAGCTGIAAGTPTGTTETSNTTSTPTSSSTVFDPNSDAFAVPKSGLTFPNAASEKLFDTSVAAAASATKKGDWLQLARNYGGGNDADEKWCSSEVTKDECSTGRLPDEPGSVVIVHGIYTYQQSLPMTVEGQDVSVVATAAVQSGWSMSAYLAVRRPSAQNPNDDGEQSFGATVNQGPPPMDADIRDTQSITISDSPSYQLAGLPSGTWVQAKGGAVTVPASGDALAQLKLFTTSANQLKTHMTQRLQALRQAVNTAIDSKQYTVCVLGVAPTGVAGNPAPPCNPRVIAAADVAALHAAVDKWFSQQNTLLTNNSAQIFAAITKPFNWSTLAE